MTYVSADAVVTIQFGLSGATLARARSKYQELEDDYGVETALRSAGSLLGGQTRLTPLAQSAKPRGSTAGEVLFHVQHVADVANARQADTSWTTLAPTLGPALVTALGGRMTVQAQSVENLGVRMAPEEDPAGVA